MLLFLKKEKAELTFKNNYKGYFELFFIMSMSVSPVVSGDESDTAFNIDSEVKNKASCIWCKDFTVLVEGTKYCHTCLKNSYKICSRCKIPYPDSKYFKDSKNGSRCNACHHKYTKEKEKYQQRKNANKEASESKQKRKREEEEETVKTSAESEDEDKIIIDKIMQLYSRHKKKLRLKITM